MYNNLLFISCIFGKHFKYVHPSPDNKNSYFFTNNRELKNEIINKGWNYIFVDKDLTDDYLVSSLQSKYIKFLEFLDDFPEFENREIIIYFDHKENISTATVDEIQLLINKNPDKSLIIRQTPSEKTNVHQEIEAAMTQNRYAKNMNLTKKFIKDITSTKEFSENVRICNTGLLIYINRHKIRELLKNVYNKCIEHQQPECQIYWSIFSQKYKNEITEIKWTDIKNKRKGPDQDNKLIGTVDYRKLEKNVIEKPKSLEESFDTIYDKKMWTDNNKFTLSGPGSEIRYAKNCITFLTDFIKKKNIRKIIDGSCGDCLWIMEVLKEFPDIEYIGYDISKKIININKEKYKKYSFYQDNLLTFAKIPECDLFIFRHTMMHLSMNDNVKFINMLKNNSNCFVFLTHHEIKSNNQGEPHDLNMSSLKWVEKNLHIKPFEIEEYIVDKFRECYHNSNEFGCIYKFNEKKDKKISVLPIKLNLSNEYLETTTDIININNIIKKHTNSVEGNCLYQHKSNFQQFEDKRYDEKKILRENFFNIVKDAKNLLEIGLNGGHSMAIFFLSNPKLEVLSFDICEHNYVRDVAKYYNNKYNFNFVEGSSLITIKEYKNEKKYDVIHIDGGHSEECVRNDLINCKRFCHKDTLMIFDDTNAVHISKILNEYCEKNFIKEIDYSEDLKKCFFHRIFKYQSV